MHIKKISIIITIIISPTPPTYLKPRNTPKRSPAPPIHQPQIVVHHTKSSLTQPFKPNNTKPTNPPNHQHPSSYNFAKYLFVGFSFYPFFLFIVLHLYLIRWFIKQFSFDCHKKLIKKLQQQKHAATLIIDLSLSVQNLLHHQN